MIIRPTTHTHSHNKFINHSNQVMSLELIIKEIKLVGNILRDPSLYNEQTGISEAQQRKYRVKVGDEQFTSRQFGTFVSSIELHFEQPFSYLYEGGSFMLYVEVFKQHRYLDNSDLDDILVAEVDLSDLTSLHGDYIEVNLVNIGGERVGKLILAVQTFKKGKKFIEKVSSKVFFEAVKKERARIQASQAAKNIKNLMVNNTLADTLMTISTMTLIPEKEDTQIFMREGFIMVRYGVNIKAFSSVLKMASKDGVNWNDYMEFMKNDGVKFEFFFLHYDELGNLTCRAKGQIKYVVFDETINLHSINMLDKKSNKYGTLMVKFNEKTVDKVTINNKVDKKLKDLDDTIQASLEEFNHYKFTNKNNNHILSEKMWELEQKALAEQQEKERPLNPEEKKKQNEHGQFISFLQKEMIKIERQLHKREQNNKNSEKKSMFLPNLEKKENTGDSRMRASQSSTDFQAVRLPRLRNQQ